MAAAKKAKQSEKKSNASAALAALKKPARKKAKKANATSRQPKRGAAAKKATKASPKKAGASPTENKRESLSTKANACASKEGASRIDPQMSRNQPVEAIDPVATQDIGRSGQLAKPATALQDRYMHLCACSATSSISPS